MKTPRFDRIAGSLALVGIATGIGLALSMDLTEASLLLLVAVLLASLLGPWAGATAAGGGFVALVYCFTTPGGNFSIERDDDLVALGAFLVTAALIGWVVTRLDSLRQTAEHRAREAQIRLDLTHRLGGGDDPTTVAASRSPARGARCSSGTRRAGRWRTPRTPRRSWGRHRRPGDG